MGGGDDNKSVRSGLSRTNTIKTRANSVVSYGIRKRTNTVQTNT